MKRSAHLSTTLIPDQTRPASPRTKIGFIAPVRTGSWLFPYLAEGGVYVEDRYS